MSINAVLANQQSWHIQQGDVLDVLRQVPDGVVQCVVTSPPYWSLRDYGTAEWEGGNPNCDHRQEAIRNRRNLAEAANACDGGNRKAENRSDKDALWLPYRNVCAKCGARRIDRQIGLEPTPEEYVERLVAVFREVRRVLREDGTVWLNLGSSFVSGIIESQEYILRDDLTAEELEYVYSELAKHFEAQSKAVPDLREAHASAEQEMSGLLRPGKGAA